MTYEAEISRVNPTCFLFLVDQSGSMVERWGGDTGRTKAQGSPTLSIALWKHSFIAVPRATILLTVTISVSSATAEMSAWGFPIDALAGNVLQPVSLIDANPLRMEERVRRSDDGTGILLEQRVTLPLWLEPRASGKTPMCAAFHAAYEVICGFVAQHPACFPPIVINITDGMATDGDAAHLLQIATAFRGVASQDGNVLLFNTHVSARGERPVLFPTDESNLADDYARLLFHMSSPLPPAMLRQAQIQGESIPNGAVGFAFNADLASVIMFLDIGTRGDKMTT